MPSPRFTLKSLLHNLNLPASEHSWLADCLDSALDAAARDGWGNEGAPVTERDLLRLPHLLGYAAVAAVRHAELSPATQLRFAQYTLQQARPLEDNGTPRGLTVLLSCLAGQGALDLAGFTAALKMAEIERGLFDEIKLGELRVLTDWLMTQAELDDRQRLWWLWFLAGNCRKPHLGQPWIDAVLAHPALSRDFKHKLCAAWLSARPPSRAPEAWRKLDQALSARMKGAEAPDEAVDLDGPGLSRLDDDDDADADDDDVFASLNVAGHLMRSALGDYLLIPKYIQRRAVMGLAQSGDDPLAVCQRYLASDRRDDTGTLNQAVADVLRGFHAQMPPDAVQALIEKGLTRPQVNTRKAFYALAAELYGPDVWQQAQRDTAKSVRAWAEKKAAMT